MKLAEQLLKYEVEIGPPEDTAAPQLGDEPPEVIVPGELWAKWLAQARTETGSGAQPKPYRWGLVACSKSKLAQPAKARDLYTGQLFRASLAAAERLCERVVILSALHGAVELEQVLEPYDERIPTTVRGRSLWSSRVHGQLLILGMRYRRDGTVLCLAPSSYWSCLHNDGWDKPLEGLGIGQQKAKLKQLAAGPEAPDDSERTKHFVRRTAGQHVVDWDEARLLAMLARPHAKPRKGRA